VLLIHRGAFTGCSLACGERASNDSRCHDDSRPAAGRFTYYRLRPEVLEALGAQFATLAETARGAEKRPC
jgi:hypothetical protein